jgi:hypothetical protein
MSNEGHSFIRRSTFGVRCSMFIIMVLLAAPLGAQTTQPSKKVETSIRSGVKFLLSRQNADGSWSDPNEETDPNGGETALITLSLLSCGESYQSPALDSAIKFLKRIKPQKTHRATYAISLRACVYAQLPEAVRKDELRADYRWLQEAIIDRGNWRGMYDYNAAGGAYRADFSNSQYAVLGVWYAQLCGFNVPRPYWAQVEQAWLHGQMKDGGWPYMPTRPRPYASMTAAALATLYITGDYLHSREAEDLSKPTTNDRTEQIDKGLEWLGKYFAVDFNPGLDAHLGERPVAPTDLDIFVQLGRPNTGSWVHYMLFGYERVGEASGLTRFGEHKWFDEGADYLLRTQREDGSWHGDLRVGNECNTAYSLLFLSRGRAPVIVQKLQFDGRWNNRSRDVADFTYFMRRASERHENWQIVSADATPAELREAPMLYVASDRAIKLTDEQKARLKTYIDQGGMIVAVNEGKESQFADSITALAREWYPAYQFRDLPADHPIYAVTFPTTPGEPIRGLSNGLRELIVLYPTGDMTWKWQSAGGTVDEKESPYATLANLLLYVTGRANPRFKGDDIWVDRRPDVAPTRSLRLARVIYDGNCDPEPGAWPRLANLMWNDNLLDLHIEPTPAPTHEQPLAHITATQSLQLPAPSKAALSNYLGNGGLLLMDAAGGSTEAAGSFEPLIKELFPSAKIAPLPADHPIYRAKQFGGQDIEHVTYRHPTELQLTHAPRLRGAWVDGKLIAVISTEDLTGGLVGYSTAGLTGYSPQDATELVRNLVLWRTITTQAHP